MKFTDRNWAILDSLRVVASQLDRPMAQVALAWTLTRPGITASIIGASKVEQLHESIAALEIRFTPEQLKMLNDSSDLGYSFPYSIFTPEINRGIFGGNRVQGW